MRVLLVALLLLATHAFAADDTEGYENFDSDTGLYFHPISVEVKGGQGSFCFSCDAADHDVIVNLFVYDPAKKTGRNLFSRPPGEIRSLIIESEYDAKERKMVFLGDGRVKNNKNIRPRKPSDQILIESYACSDEKNCRYTLWKAGKMGGEPKVLFAFSQSEAESIEWHLDVKNRVVRLLTRTQTGYAVREFDWQ
ncbi:MAG TPA: hypothetical protein VIU46_01235 [Gallionellaceae bacterium]